MFVTVKESCSEAISNRIDKVSSSLQSLKLHVCGEPVTYTEMEEEREGEGEEEGEHDGEEIEEMSCNWKKCLEPVIPYFRTNGAEKECV